MVQLGTELRHLLDERNEEYVAVDVAEMDITNAEKVDEVFAGSKPTLVYHCAALHSCWCCRRWEGKELDTMPSTWRYRKCSKSIWKAWTQPWSISRPTTFLIEGINQLGQEWEVDDQPDPQSREVVPNVWEELVERYVSNFYIISLGLWKLVRTLSSPCRT